MNDNDPLVGSAVGGYKIDSFLAEGGMGKVYKATGPDEARVALKLVKPDYAADETFRRRFNREARIASTVKHPNVVPVVATGEHDGIPYMAQVFIDGPGSLDAIIKRDGQLDVQTALRICNDVA